MKYAKWKLDFLQNPEYGQNCDEIVRERGQDIRGVFFAGDGSSENWLVGYVSDDFDASGLEAYSMTEISQQEALQMCQARNPACYLDDNGELQTPNPFDIN